MNNGLKWYVFVLDEHLNGHKLTWISTLSSLKVRETLHHHPEEKKLLNFDEMLHEKSL